MTEEQVVETDPICGMCGEALDTNNNQEVESGYCSTCLGDMQ